MAASTEKTVPREYALTLAAMEHQIAESYLKLEKLSHELPVETLPIEGRPPFPAPNEYWDTFYAEAEKIAERGELFVGSMTGLVERPEMVRLLNVRRELDRIGDEVKAAGDQLGAVVYALAPEEARLDGSENESWWEALYNEAEATA